MGALFAMMFFAIIFFIAMFFVIANVVIIIIWSVRKRRGKNPRKWWFIVPLIFLIFNVVVALIPVGFVGFLRVVNSYADEPVVYSDSGVVIYWPTEEHNLETTAWFEMDGNRYVSSWNCDFDNKFYIDDNDEKRGEPIANLRYDPKNRDAFNNFMWFVLSGKTYENQNDSISTLYPVTNENDFDIYYVNGGMGTGTYFLESDVNAIREYYSDIKNYDMQNLNCPYYDQTENGYWIEKEVDFKQGVFEELYSFRSDKQSRKSFQVDPSEDYKDATVHAYSKDGIAYMQAPLVLVGNKVYAWCGNSGYDYEGYPLSDEMSQYLIETVFSD